MEFYLHVLKDAVAGAFAFVPYMRDASAQVF